MRWNFRHRGFWIAVAIVAAIVALRLTLFAPKPLVVETAAVERGAVEDVVTNSQAGTVRSRRRAQVGAERAGRVASIPKREGALVHAGDPLVLLDASTARTDLDVAGRNLETQRAVLQGAEAAARLAEQEYRRIEPLRTQGLVSEESLESARARLDGTHADLKAAEARVSAAQAAVDRARDEVRHLTILAPFDGVVAERLVEVGESVVPGQPVSEVLDPHRLYVVAPLDEIDIGRVRVDLPARVSLDPYPEVHWSGSVARVAPAVNDRQLQNRTLDVDVDLALDDAHPVPKPGTSADVEIILDRRDRVLRVPTFAVLEGKRVLVLDRGYARSRTVEIGVKNWEWTEVRSGLNEGERVITNLDKQGIRDGVRAVARSEAPGEASASPARR
jgi:HlyD family secretion protein